VVWSHGDLGSLEQTVHTHRASVYQAAKLAAALLGVARVTAGLAESNGNRRVYDSRHLQADCQEPGSAPEPYTLSNRVWDNLYLFYCSLYAVNEDLQHLSTARMPVEYVVCRQGSQARAEVA